MIKVGYDCGHGLFTPGKETPDKEKEWSFNNKVARAFANELAFYEGVASKRFDDPTGKRDVPLNERTDGANNWGADYYISFHHNANTAKWGNWTGVETYVYINPQEESRALAKAIHPALVKAYGLTDRGIKEKNLHIVRETKMPAILIEGGFMDSLIDIEKLRDDRVLENAGKLIAQAFAKFVGLKKTGEEVATGAIVTETELVNDPKPVVTVKPTKTKPVTKPTPKPTVKETLWVDGKWGPATTRALQRHYGTTVDGVISGQPKNESTKNIPSIDFGNGGSKLIRAMQKDLGTTVDGVISSPSQMIRALQKRLGTVQDGKVSNPSLMVKAMQKALNNGKF